MKILVTGAKGFIGTHVCTKLTRAGFEVIPFDLGNTDEELVSGIKEASYVIHLAGINRPLTPEEFYDGNTNFTKKVVDLVKEVNQECVIIANSSTQAALDNDYGRSKKLAEDYLIASGLKVYIYRFANVFGRGCRPNYNSATATFCYNIAHDLDVFVRDPNYVVNYNYVDDIADEFVKLIKGEINREFAVILSISPLYSCSLGKQVELLKSFKKAVQSEKHLPILNDEFELKLFMSFLFYLSDEGMTYNYATDQRGSFEELYKSKEFGQISMNMSYPGITKGGHYHTYKKEIFDTVKGHCLIRQRHIENNDWIIDDVTGDKQTPVNIIPMYTHEITNVGDENSYTLMWISEVYSELTPDTFRAEVEIKK